MPWTPRIPVVIPQQNFELIGDRIAEILAAEMANQWGLDNTVPKVVSVDIERFTTYDGQTELPAINVNNQSATYSNRTRNRVDGTYQFNIDVYTNATWSAEDGPGDEYAMLLMNRIIGMVRTILSSPAYTRLGFDAPADPIIGTTNVAGFIVGDKATVKDSLSSVVGRLQFEVTCVEEAIMQTSVPLEVSGSTLYVNRAGGKGFKLLTEI